MGRDAMKTIALYNPASGSVTADGGDRLRAALEEAGVRGRRSRRAGPRRLRNAVEGVSSGRTRPLHRLGRRWHIADGAYPGGTNAQPAAAAGRYDEPAHQVDPRRQALGHGAEGRAGGSQAQGHSSRQGERRTLLLRDARRRPLPGSPKRARPCGAANWSRPRSKRAPRWTR